MEQEAVELAKAHAACLEKILHGRSEMRAQKLRQLRAQHHPEAVMPDVLVSRSKDPPAPACRSSCALRVAENDARSAIAEQRRRHEHRHARIVDAEAEAAKIDGEK